jgi:murein DD-endopeptidase MepM/ murein hydrolase activator NlpD
MARMSKALARATSKTEWSMLIPLKNGNAMRIGPSTATVVAVCTLVLVFFSVADFRETIYQKRERALVDGNFKNNREMLAFAQWLSEKNQDLSRYLVATGDPSVQEASAASNEVTPSIEGIQQSLERIENRIRIISDLQLRDEDYFWNVPSISPVALKEEFTLATGPLSNSKQLSGVSSLHGLRFHPVNRKESMHYGLDIFCPEGSQIRATANGTVTFVGRFSPNEDNLRHSYGNFIQVRHGDTGIETFYAHLSSIKVSKNQLVKRGDIIGLSGNTGTSSGPHLHYEVVRNGTKVNPLNYITDVPLFDGGRKVFYVKNNVKKGKARKK